MTINELYEKCDAITDCTMFYVIDPDDQIPLEWGVTYCDMKSSVAIMYINHFNYCGNDEVLVWVM